MTDTFANTKKSSFSKSARTLSRTFSRKNKHASDRVNSVSSRVSTRFGFDADDSDTVKPARLVFKTYLDGGLDTEKIALSETVVVRALKTSPGAAIARWTKFKGVVSLGDGKFRCVLKKGSKNSVQWTFDIGTLKNIGYKRKGAKDFSLSFTNNDKLLNVVCDTGAKAEAWLLAIFAEIRVQASVFSAILRRTLNPTWIDVLKINRIDCDGLAGDEEETLTQEQEKALIMDDASMSLAETCLREEIDLWTLCRGKDHPDVIEAYARLSIWLKRNFRHQEAKYWQEAAEKGRTNHSYRMKAEMNAAEVTMKTNEDSALDELRNPSGMQPLDKLSVQREQNARVNIEERINVVMDKLQNTSSTNENEGEGEVDPFEALL